VVDIQEKLATGKQFVDAQTTGLYGDCHNQLIILIN
jgi:hypothetical protein